MQYSGFGNGSDGYATLSGTDAPIDSSCSGSSGTKSVSATNASFASGKIILIHQSSGTGVGNWELNIIDSYSAGTITTLFNLVNTYADSGVSQSQVIQLKEYSSVVISGTFTAKAWDGNVGGILSFLCQGETEISGACTASGKGYRGADGVRNSDGKQGEGYNAAGGTVSINANTVGAGGGWAGDNHGGFGGGAGGGGGHVTAGAGGGAGGTQGLGGANGTIGADGTDGVKMHFGGGGGSGGEQYDAGTAGIGGAGGGIIFILTQSLTVTGSLSANGAAGTNSTSSSDGGGGGGGAGGYVYIRASNITAGTNLISATGGAGGAYTGSGGTGGAGANGVVRIETCSITGSTNPAAVGTVGGYDWCTVFGSIY